MTMSRLRVLPLLLALCAVLSIGGVFATWIYCESPLPVVYDNIVLEMDIFQWSGSEVLPDDEDSGLAHAKLIDRLINGEGIGLNSSGSYLNEQIRNRDRYWNRDTLGSMAIKQGDSLSDLFNLETENVIFLIQMKSDNTYYIFTTSLYLGENGNLTYPVGTRISPIYRTTVQKNGGVWTATVTEEGSAASAYYEESQLIFITRSKIPSFDPDSWKKTA